MSHSHQATYNARYAANSRWPYVGGVPEGNRPSQLLISFVVVSPGDNRSHDESWQLGLVSVRKVMDAS
jgi:hypothetical protein